MLLMVTWITADMCVIANIALISPVHCTDISVLFCSVLTAKAPTCQSIEYRVNYAPLCDSHSLALVSLSLCEDWMLTIIKLLLSVHHVHTLLTFVVYPCTCLSSGQQYHNIRKNFFTTMTIKFDLSIGEATNYLRGLVNHV